jgi:hypothetical protein
MVDLPALGKPMIPQMKPKLTSADGSVDGHYTLNESGEAMKA